MPKTENEVDGHMQLEAYAAMQQELGTQHPNLKRLAAAHRVISATGDQTIKEAYVLEANMRVRMLMENARKNDGN